MDFQELKEIIQKDGGKVIIVEDDKPQIVVMSFEEYKRNNRNNKNTPQPVSPVVQSVQKSEEREKEGGDLTIDDLPLL